MYHLRVCFWNPDKRARIQAMVEAIKKFLFDFWADGRKALGGVNLLLAVAFTAAKFFGWLAVLEDVSYAWAFAPLSLWALFAYIKRRTRHIALINSRNQALAPTELAIETGNDERFRKKAFGPETTPKHYLLIKGIAKVIGGKTIYDCEIFATKFEKLVGADFVKIAPHERIRLKWAFEEKSQINIIPNAPAHFGLVSARQFKPRFLISTHQAGSIPADAFEQPGKYRISLVLSGKGTPDANASVVINWDGNWEKLSVSKDE
jgi:hypothetical protein